MKKEISLLDKGVFNSALLDSKATTRTVSTKEKIFGHLIGPLGLIFVVNTIAALVEKFFTQQVGLMYGLDNIEMVKIMGSRYEVVMTIAKVLALFCGLGYGWLMQHTKSRQGRMRPWYLIFGFISIVTGGLIFLFSGESMGESYWIYFFFLLVVYNTVGSTYFYLFKDTIVSLTTRNPGEKTELEFLRKLCWTLISGIIIGMIINMVVLPMWLEKDIKGYPILMVSLSVAAIPLLLMEYYYTRERITEDLASEKGLENENNIPLMEQFKAMAHNRYFIIMMIIITVGGIVDNFKGGNVQYFYIKFLLGGDSNPLMYTIYQIATGAPLGVGAFLVYPLAKKYGIKNVTWAGFVIALLCSILGWIYPDNLPVVIVTGFLRNIGWLPQSYIFMALMAFTYDSIEYQSDIRLEGLMGLAVITALQQLIYAPFAGGFESGLLKLGFVDVDGVMASETVRNFMTMSFYMFDIIKAAVIVILLPFVDVEKKLPEISAELERRKKEAVLAKGEEWIDPEELEKREKEEALRQTEEDRIADLKEKCRRKGLDFDTENQKYLDKKARKEKKKAGK